MKKNHIGNLNKTQCFGCTACAYTCPFGAIIMERDQEGFFYPRVDEQKCTDCGRCRRICPSVNPKDMTNSSEPETYAVRSENAVRRKSSSGGSFTLLARSVLDKGGVVCGVVMNEKFQVFHTFARNEKELEPMRRSKYVESNLGDIFPRIRELLDEKKKVLFTGTPCQVAGLKAYLGKNREGLFTADLMCHGATSSMVFHRYLEETYGIENVRTYYFRTKKYGYNGTTSVAVMKNGRSYMCSDDKDPFVKGSYRSLFLRRSCEDCKFASLPRQGDLTIGDFWGLRAYDKELHSELGTSLVLVNNDRGKELLEDALKDAGFVKKLPFEAAKKNRFREKMHVHSQRDRFFEMLQYTSMHKAVEYCTEGRYDVGMLGVWFGCNYGSIATYYGLMKQLQGLGLSVLMIDKPGYTDEDRELSGENHSRIFANAHFHVSRKYALSEMHLLNHKCDSFVIGSDQVWNYGICRNFGRSFLMDFVRDEKKKVAVAVSFGHEKDFRPERERLVSAEYLKRFDAISVRETSAVDILEKTFGVSSVRVLDPVFSTDRSVYDAIAEESSRRETEPYLLTYILDPTPEKKEAIRFLSEKLGLRAVHILDGTPWNYESNKEKMGMDGILENVKFQDWIYYFKNSSYVLTDSCHGVSFALIYHKPFAGIGNCHRGMERFHSLTHLFQVEDRVVTDPLEITKSDRFLKPVDYDKVAEIMEKEKEISSRWLRDAMFKEKESHTSQTYAAQITPVRKEDIRIVAQRVQAPPQPLWKKIFSRLPESVQKGIKEKAGKYRQKR